MEEIEVIEYILWRIRGNRVYIMEEIEVIEYTSWRI